MGKPFLFQNSMTVEILTFMQTSWDKASILNDIPMKKLTTLPKFTLSD